jgi:hypothetical protein
MPSHSMKKKFGIEASATKKIVGSKERESDPAQSFLLRKNGEEIARGSRQNILDKLHYWVLRDTENVYKLEYVGRQIPSDRRNNWKD